jgi:hypothetical protein
VDGDNVMSEPSEKRQRGRSVTLGIGEHISLRVPVHVAAALDTYAYITDAKSRDEAVREIVTNFLERGGML